MRLRSQLNQAGVLRAGSLYRGQIIYESAADALMFAFYGDDEAWHLVPLVHFVPMDGGE